jgi:Zn-dependent protease
MTAFPMHPENPEPEPNAKNKKSLAVLGAVGLSIAAKGKALLGLLKAVPVAKALLTFGSFGGTIFLYALKSGLPFAFGFVLLIMIHELGHAYAMRVEGVRASWPVFIPFMGAFIAMKDVPVSADSEARIAIAGPVAGTAGALACAALGLWLHAPLYLALAYSAFFLNLFNLVPFGFLDGARVARVFSKRAWIVGGLVMLGLMLLSPSPQLLFIGLMGLSQALRRAGEPVEVTPSQQRLWSLRYFGLVSFLVGCLYFTGTILHRHPL